MNNYIYLLCYNDYCGKAAGIYALSLQPRSVTFYRKSLFLSAVFVIISTEGSSVMCLFLFQQRPGSLSLVTEATVT